MNEASWRGTRLTRTTPATRWRADKSTTFPSASALTCLPPPGSGTYLSALPVCPAPWMDSEQILTPWSLSSPWDTQSLHKPLLESLCKLCTRFGMPFWGFSENHTIRGSSVGTSSLLLKTLYCKKTWCEVLHMTF